MIRPLAFVLAIATALAAVAGAVYGAEAGLEVARIFVPAGIGTVLVALTVSSLRSRLGGLRRQFGAGAVLALAQSAVVVGLFVNSMFVSRHDAFFAALVVVWSALLAVGVGCLLARRSFADLDAIRAALGNVGDGGRQVSIRVAGGGELAVVAREVESMVARLSAEERARRRLIASVSHDLRTPITALQLMSDAIEDDLVEPEMRREYLGRMGTHVRALSALIEDLFELSRLEAGDISWSIENVHLAELVAETVEAMRPHAEAEAVSVQAELAPGLAIAKANPEQIQRVLFNLIQNGIRHTPADGSVVVRAQQASEAIEVEVADTGTGITREDAANVFEPFVQGSDRACRTNGSAGLGLAIARAIVEAHGGRIWLEDAPLGTKVRFSLPT